MPSKISKTKLEHSNWQFEAIGTHWSIETDDVLSTELKKEVSESIDSFDQVYSRFRDDSTVSQMSRRAGTFELDESSMRLAEFYRQMYDLTNGAVTPLIGRGLIAGGYDKDYSLSPTAPLPAPIWDDGIRWDGRTMTIKQPIVLDIGAAGKGLLVDKVANILESADITQYVIDASGDIRHRGGDAQTVGLENPHDPTKVIGTYLLRDASLCASASNRRKWGDGWHHVLDGRTGVPTNDVIATWVMTGDTMIADGLATALFFVDAQRLAGIADFQFVSMRANGKIEHSKQFMGQLYI